MDSPIRIALSAQRAEGGAAEDRLLEAENALRAADFERAIQIYRDAAKAQPTNPLIRMKLGILLRDRGRWSDALQQFEAALGASPNYAEAWREKGVAENKLAWGKAPPDPPSAPAPGESALLQALALKPDDFDAAASLGGVLKRAGRWAEAQAAYKRSRDASSDHPYPLLNEIKLRAKSAGKLELTPADRRALTRAERLRGVQAEQKPPYDKPWCFFDLAEIRLYLGKADEAPGLILVRASGTRTTTGRARPSSLAWNSSNRQPQSSRARPLPADVARMEDEWSDLRQHARVSTAAQSGSLSFANKKADEFPAHNGGGGTRRRPRRALINFGRATAGFIAVRLHRFLFDKLFFWRSMTTTEDTTAGPELPSYEGIIFISYARADDEKPPFDNSTQGWVTFFGQQLRFELTDVGLHRRSSGWIATRSSPQRNLPIKSRRRSARLACSSPSCPRTGYNENFARRS